MSIDEQREQLFAMARYEACKFKTNGTLLDKEDLEQTAILVVWKQLKRAIKKNVVLKREFTRSKIRTAIMKQINQFKNNMEPEEPMAKGIDLDEQIDAKDVADKLKYLKPKERLIMQLRFGIECRTFAEIGEIVGLSGSKAHSIYKEAMAKMRELVLGNSEGAA